MLLSTLLDGNLQIVDLSDLNAPLPLTVDSSTQILTRTQDWEHSSFGNPAWPSGGLSTLGYPTVVKNTHGLNPDGNYYYYYAHHDPMSGIGAAVATTIDGPYTKISPTDSKVLTVPNYNPAGPNPGDPSHYSSPTVVWNEDTQLWHLYFHYFNHFHSAWDANPSYPGQGFQMTALATTPDLSSHNWTILTDPSYSVVSVDDIVPVLHTTDEDWANEATSYNYISRLPDDTWLAFMRGTTELTNDGSVTELGFATSSDGINFNYFAENSTINSSKPWTTPSTEFRPKFIGYLGKNGSNEDEFLVAWGEGGNPQIIYGTTTDFKTFVRDARGYASWGVGEDGTVSAFREGNSLFLFTGTDVLEMILPVSPPLLPGAIDFSTVSIDSYGGGQDVTGTATVEDNGATLHLTGNNWKKVDFAYNVTANTLMEFDFRSPREGEIQAIGFDTDLVVGSPLSFQLYGSDTWQNQSFNTYGPKAPNTVHFTIPLGQFATGQYNHLFFANDDDFLALSDSYFTNVQVYEGTPMPGLINFGAFSIDSYGGGQDVTGTATVEDNGATLRLTGNNWKKVDFAYNVTANTLMEFDFRSPVQGEIQSIGFDVDLVTNSPASFQVYGWEVWQNQDFHDYAPSAPNTKHYTIPLGTYTTGAYNYLFFGNDDDSLTLSDSYFTNVQVYDSGPPPNVPPVIVSLNAGPDPVNQGDNLTLTANGVSDSDGTVVQVEFYRDSNSSGSLEVGTDLLLGADTSSAGGWTWTGSTAAFPLGANRYFARAQDNEPEWSNTVTITGTVDPVPNVPPSIVSLSPAPDPVLRGNNLTLTANGVTDSDGTVLLAKFYRDSNSSGSLEVGTDELLGTDNSSAGGWDWTGSTTAFPMGTNRYFARAQDDALAWSNTETITGTVDPPLPGMVDFGAYTIDSFDGVQDVSGTATVEDGGATLHMTGNNWKKIDLPYNITANTVLEFDFRSPVQGEVHAIGFDTDLAVKSPAAFQVYGWQIWENQDFNDYGPSAPNTKHYTIPLGAYTTGSQNYLFFGNDDDSLASGDIYFTNVQVLEADPPPQVSEVLIGSTAWTGPFLDQFEAVGAGGTRGYAFPVGSADQLDAVPWVNADQVIIRFNEQVNVDQGDLVLTGVNVGSYGYSGFQAETGPTGEYQAVWTLSAPIGSDKLRIRLDGTTGAAVTDMSSNVLDGEWVDSTSTHNSGDGSAGGDFAFRFNVLPSDSNGDGFVTLNPDVQGTLNGLGTSIGVGGYSAFNDVNGDGMITLNPDVQTTLNGLGTNLPAGEPSGPTAITTIDFGAYYAGYDYGPTAPNTKHYLIPVGQFFMGPVSFLIFGNDGDAQAAGDSVYSNVRIYEA